jgi:hypothetical protein
MDTSSPKGLAFALPQLASGCSCNHEALLHSVREAWVNGAEVLFGLGSDHMYPFGVRHPEVAAIQVRVFFFCV